MAGAAKEIGATRDAGGRSFGIPAIASGIGQSRGQPSAVVGVELSRSRKRAGETKSSAPSLHFARGLNGGLIVRSGCAKGNRQTDHRRLRPRLGYPRSTLGSHYGHKPAGYLYGRLNDQSAGGLATRLRIPKGEEAADLEGCKRQTKYELVVNLTDCLAKALGLTVPDMCCSGRRCDE